MSNPSCSQLSLPLTFCTYHIYTTPNRFVYTEFPDDYSCIGTREDTESNRRQALEDGYTGTDIVWRHLVEHELLHSLVADILFARPSAVLRTEAGAAIHPLRERYEEEAIVLSMQQYLNADTSEGRGIHIAVVKFLRRYGSSKIRRICDQWDANYYPLLKSHYIYHNT